MIFDKKLQTYYFRLLASGETKRWGVNNFVKVTTKYLQYKCKFYLAEGQLIKKLLMNLSTKVKVKIFFLSRI